jgi:phosphohistidine phosphatase
MKALYLLRHAKSSWDDPSLSDRERPLNARGARDAPRMGAALSARYAPMTFYVSPAERAQATFAGVRSGWPELQVGEGITTEALYTFDYRKLLAWIEQQSDDADALALIGHNPALTELMGYFAGWASLDHLPTAGWAELAIAIERWSDICQAQGRGELVTYLLPRTLRETS